jgi:hypothetical protein
MGAMNASLLLLPLLLLTACASEPVRTGDPRVQGGAEGCARKCQARGMALGGVLEIGEYSDGCFCEPVAAKVGGASSFAARLRPGLKALNQELAQLADEQNALRKEMAAQGGRSGKADPEGLDRLALLNQKVRLRTASARSSLQELRTALLEQLRRERADESFCEGKADGFYCESDPQPDTLHECRKGAIAASQVCFSGCDADRNACAESGGPAQGSDSAG